MNIITLDYETYFDNDYTLSKMTTEAFIRDPRFEAHGASVKLGPNEPVVWYDEPELRQLFTTIDWTNTGVVCHHAQWDCGILSFIYNVHPKFIFCTLAMGRLLFGNHLSIALASLALHFGLQPKGVPYHLFKGQHWKDISPLVKQQCEVGFCHDTALCWDIFGILGKEFPRSEYEVVDATVRMFTRPVLRGDVEMLAKIWEDENAAKIRRKTALGVTSAELNSANKFAELLRAEGVDPPMKDGKVDENTGQPRSIYAFAKTDQFMRDLLEDPDERIRALAEARIGQKSTQLQTRAETFGFMARRGRMPVYLNYAGAHTTRWSGGDDANWQNLKRDDPDNPGQASPLRRAIMAPPGYVLGVVDLSQIECRLLCYLAEQEDYVEKFRTGEDPYISTASKAYKMPVTKEMKKERGTGKQLVLSCGFQAGADTIVKTARLGIYGPPVYIDYATGLEWRDAYRDEFYKVVEYWRIAGRMIARVAGGDPLQWGPMLIRDKCVFGPGGTMLNYKTLEWHVPGPDEVVKEFEQKGFWRFKSRRGWVKLYSGKFVENFIQWLARIVLSQAMVRIIRMGYCVATTTHDELLLVFKKDGSEQERLDRCMVEMKRTPDWLPGLPLDCEGGLSERYSK